MQSLLDHPLLAARYFFPRREPVSSPFFVTASDGVSRLACHRSMPYPGALTLLHFHGNAEVVADYVPAIAQLVNALGVNVVFAEYRGYGGSTGSPSLRAMLDDAEAVFQAMDVSARRVVPFGRSLGSLFAVEIASRHPEVAGLVLESGIADVLDRNLVRVTPEDLGASPLDLEAAVKERFDQRAKLAAYTGPLLVMHTRQDALVAPSHGERTHNWGGAPTADKTLVMFEEGDHGTIFLVNNDAYLRHLRNFLRNLD
jgi:pimeloyl-ACP methyl ester carboxylesterase